MSTSITTIDSASLHFREGRSDKVYHAAIESKGDGYIVTFAYGRRGNTLTTGIKTPQPVPLEQARQVFDKLVHSKLRKGYTRSTDGTPYRGTASGSIDTGIRPQLLNPIEESEVGRLIGSPKFCLQEKHDGRRLLVRKRGDTITGINRRGLAVAIPGPVHDAVAGLPCDVIIDGEAVGDALHAFDLLELEGRTLRELGYLDRFKVLMGVLPMGNPALCWIATPLDPDDKLATYEELRATGAEGVVFKDIDAPYRPGRPNSGGPQLKFKFVETASFIVAGRNGTKHSVGLELLTAEGNRVSAGNVTIPANHEVPEKGTVVEARYLYAHRESGAIYQPVYLGPRDDIPADECTVDQLKFKAEPLAVVTP
ncbi:WGR domain-containing protein [Haloferula sp. A504]|uniref:WGR domain-containing protein n=1 Tax=Haloferula sp. A504 TaxID=3373601 RepID=UPI0031BF2BBB|nr:WGR domain-containing protein [Verrucomicrobiaceae bacterium E54]